MQLTPEQEAFQWQVGVWDRISHLYFREVDPRFASVVAGTIKRADPKPGEKQAADYISVLDELGIDRLGGLNGGLAMLAENPLAV